MFFSIGFYRVTIKGVRASEKEAPILALAPHSSFHDAFPVVLLTAPSLVVKADTQKIPFFASMIILSIIFSFIVLFFLIHLLSSFLLDWLLLGSVHLLSFYFSFDLIVHCSRSVKIAKF